MPVKDLSLVYLISKISGETIRSRILAGDQKIQYYNQS
jgi:hypothetical protein